MEKRGQIWFAVQFVLFCGILAAPFVGRFDGPLWLRLLGLVILGAGVVVAVLGYRQLGSSHSPWTNPTEGAHIVTTGIYAHIRHPIYAGWIIATVGWALLFCSFLGIAVAVAIFIFYDLRSREEERWLDLQYPDYPAYRHNVKRFIPGIY